LHSDCRLLGGAEEALEKTSLHVPVGGFANRSLDAWIRASSHGHALWLQPGFGHVGQIITCTICQTICHSVDASCHAHWMSTLGPTQRGRPLWSCSAESCAFSLAGTATFEPDSFSSKVLQFFGASILSNKQQPAVSFPVNFSEFCDLIANRLEDISS
jgi:hypothetical protein